ncbi:type I restriction endonuclease subunit R [Thiorhodovibrio frisius]|uniref:type I site-specific deoxyribonuclease n=1 Tax=Thiorhodovibrio frisius TaxID=631362 RepID=H8Z0N9_9GAMM|nr:type I restriction endonuclease [Thiorhodovibrio frisius]EIC22380.1 helicase, type I site-specific restriction-modification system restriction subunit [Thiorhodovibrio frisius]WPL24678.1 Type-1 restriction enzyme R protein [Thiorhodovibrio frisius]
MSKIEWERDLVERPFCQQLQAMGWDWIEADPDLPESSERTSSREVLLKVRLVAALRTINRRDGQPWLDDARIEKMIRSLDQVAGHRPMEVNQATTELLLKGTVVEGLPDWDQGRPQPVRYIDFQHWDQNDFLVINQFKVELSSGQGHVLPDAVLFVNGIPLVVAEFKSPAIESPMAAAINQLLRYSNQRREVWPTLYQEHEGVERLFRTNQLLIASNFFEARAGTLGAPPEAYLEWGETSPVAPAQVLAEVQQARVDAENDAGNNATGTVDASKELASTHATGAMLAPVAAEQLAALGPEQAGRAGTPLFFRDEDQRPAALRDAATALSSQQRLVAGMLRPAHLLDLMRNFTVFEQVDGRTRKIVARYQQFRAVHKIIRRLLDDGAAGWNDLAIRGGIVWHTQGSGKSLTMVFLVRKLRMTPGLQQYKVVVVTDRTDLEGQLKATARLSGETVRPNQQDLERRLTPTALTQAILREPTPDIVFAMLQKYQERREDEVDRVAMTIRRKEKKPGREQPVVEKEIRLTQDVSEERFPLLNESRDILVLVDEAHRGHSLTLHRNLRQALPNAAMIGFTGTPILAKHKKRTAEIFGDFIDCYVLKDAELDGATVPIRYEGRTADGFIKDATTLDDLFLDMFKDYEPEELAVIKARYGTDSDVLEAPLLIAQKARDMMWHFAKVILSEGYKAQVVAASRLAAVRYQQALCEARDALVAELEQLPAALLDLSEDAIEALEASQRELVRLHPQLPRLRALEVAAIISPDHNDPESWKQWSDKGKQAALIQRFKRRFDSRQTDKTDPLGMLVVFNMLLTGFDAPVEQVLYLDRKLVAHDLLQAIARVNRTAGAKPCGYVVDYIGVARHLNKALEEYDEVDVAGSMLDIAVELPKLLDRRNRAVEVFRSRGIRDLFAQVQQCVQLLAELRIRAEFINALRQFYETLNLLEHRPEVPPDVFRDAKLLGFINKVAANLYRDPMLNLVGVAEKVKSLIDTHVSARGVDPKIPPTTITDAAFEQVLANEPNGRARAAQMQHAARFHITGFTSQNPSYARQMSEKLEAILKRFKDDWDALERELSRFIEELKRGDSADFPGLEPKTQVPFVRLMLEFCYTNADADDSQRQALITATLDLVERIRREVRLVGFWRNADARERLTKVLVRDIDETGLCPPGQERDLAQRLVALAKENHEALTHTPASSRT